ncbi:MAG: hypothetical protein IKU28_09105 [Erysipelotrichaceae bacterium]|nr:hypothetical protein [Erysipelotrichaceae bacterium]
MSEQQMEFKYAVSIRFQNSRKPYTFGCNDETIAYGDFVVVETVRGLELGEVVSSLADASLLKTNTPLKPVVRKAEYEDKQAAKENKVAAKEALDQCNACIEKLKLDMNLISAEYTLDRSKIVFVYVSENRVDFRELLKELAAIFHCRIELRQIGPRDKAKLVGGLGSCGMETCCSRYLNSFDVVSINMAKNQLLALNIPKLSGQCGKLMCCLKYEDEAYTDLREGLPKQNAQVEYEGKMYRMTSMNVITRTCKLENRETALYITLDELIEKGTFKKREVKNTKPQLQPAEEPKAEEAAPVQEAPRTEEPEIKAEPAEETKPVKKDKPQRPKKERKENFKEKQPKAETEQTEKPEKKEDAPQERKEKPEKHHRHEHKDKPAHKDHKNCPQKQETPAENRPQGEKRSFKKAKTEETAEKVEETSEKKHRRPHHKGHKHHNKPAEKKES